MVIVSVVCTKHERSLIFLDNMKDAVVAKLASQCEELYAECLKTFQRENLKHIWDREWVPMVIFILITFSLLFCI